MCRLVVKYNGKKVTSFQCPTERLEEGLAFLRNKYSQCSITIC